MQPQFERSAMLMGEDALDVLATKTVAIFGLGGVGGNAADALARAGVGHLVLVDDDVVGVSNVNRQLVATLDTVGQAKVDVMARHIMSVNPAAEVVKHKAFYLPETAADFDFAAYDYVVDAVDTVAAKIDLAVRCHATATPLISAMGCGNKLDPTQLRVCDLFATAGDPLAKVMRHELRARGIESLKVVYSTEAPHTPLWQPADSPTRRATPGSTPFVPPVAGILLAAEVVKDLLA